MSDPTLTLLLQSVGVLTISFPLNALSKIVRSAINFLESPDPIRAFEIEKMMILLLPVIMFSGAFLFWIIVALFKRNTYYIKNHFIMTLVVIFYLIHPKITNDTFKIFNCKEIEPDKFYLIA
jgi:hypothetical protein